MAEILPSIFGADLGNLNDELEFLKNEKTTILHVDMMDGNFVPNIAFGDIQINDLKKRTNMIFDVHMMVDHPFDHIDSVLDAGVEMICVHYEATPHIHRLIKKIKGSGRKAGVAITPSTRPEELEYLLDDLDYILVMTINPGHKGEKFIEQSLEKIRHTKQLIGDRPIQIEVDGGVNDAIAKQCKDAGAELIVVGGFLFSNDPSVQYQKLREAIS
ncbi:ribulose-phosphate 3-epimerase [Breznakia pachnodae]|uniref:Ribulose-phosphate 3-epimerase n=1 Tax=Breznakia pachnodae TaxID=265178 RepID=A0ABU0E6V6_9FIRM|nr:ribulose-phosphate 3-epimerase [Breznakia pachnodae]MDQ0362451.1 ribulose-phosphate 3-epimerase [Breznakia pachnodae]